MTPLKLTFSAPAKSAPVTVTPLRLTPVKFASAKVAPEKLLPARVVTPAKFALLKKLFSSLAPPIVVLAKLELTKLTFEKLADVKLDPEKSAPDKLDPDMVLTPERLRLEQSALNWYSQHVTPLPLHCSVMLPDGHSSSWVYPYSVPVGFPRAPQYVKVVAGLLIEASEYFIPALLDPD